MKVFKSSDRVGVERSREETIIKTYSGNIRNLTTRGNELWALLMRLNGTFMEDENKVELESDNIKVVRKWED